MTALEEKVASALLNSASREPYPLLLARLAKQLHDDCGLAEDVAYWAVESWAMALRIPTGRPESAQQTPPHSTDSPPPPPNPHETYQQAVRKAWETAKKLTQTQANELDALAARLGLNPSTAKSVECAIMGHSKEDDLAQQHFTALAQYRTAIASAWSDETLTPAKMNDLVALAKRLSLSKDEMTTIEREIMGDTKKRIFKGQSRQWAFSEYREAVRRVWEPNRVLTEAQLAELDAQVTRLGLSQVEAATVEREIMGDTKERIFEGQSSPWALSEYREAVRRAWEPNEMLTKVQVIELVTRMVRLGLSREEAAFIELDIMGEEIIGSRLSNAILRGKKILKSARDFKKSIDEA